MNAWILHLLFAGLCMTVADKAYEENLQPAYTQYHLHYALATCTGIAAFHEFVIDSPPDHAGFERSMTGISSMYLIKFDW